MNNCGLRAPSPRSENTLWCEMRYTRTTVLESARHRARRITHHASSHQIAPPPAPAPCALAALASTAASTTSFGSDV